MNIVLQRLLAFILLLTYVFVSTQRKNADERRIMTFMNEEVTPVKNGQNMMDQWEKESILKKLDDSERRNVQIERLYAELNRKYEKIKTRNQELETEIEKEQKMRLEQLIDLQSRLHILDNESKKTQQSLHQKQQTVLLLNEKLQQKDNQITSYQQQLSRIGQKLSETCNQTKNFEHASLAQSKKQETLKNSREVSQLKKQIEKFGRLLQQKEKQKKQLLLQMDQITAFHKKQISELKESFFQNQQENRRWIEDSKIQKEKLIKYYQQQILKLKQTTHSRNLETTQFQIESLANNKILLADLQEELAILHSQLQAKKFQIEKLLRNDEESGLNLKKTQQKMKILEQEYERSLKQMKIYLQQLQANEEVISKSQKKNRQLNFTVTNLQNKITELNEEKVILEKENEKLKQKTQTKERALTEIKDELNNVNDGQMNLNSKLTENSLKLKNRINQLEEQVEKITAQLYTQRLENAKLRDELVQTKVDMKREYDLSLQNTKAELLQQIKAAQNSNLGHEQRQKLYLQMRDMEYRWQQMASQTITVNELLKKAHKIHHFYKR